MSETAPLFSLFFSSTAHNHLVYMCRVPHQVHLYFIHYYTTVLASITISINRSNTTPTYLHKLVLTHMGDRKKSKGSRSLFKAFHSASDSNLAQHPPGGPPSVQSDSGPQPEQSSEEQKPHQGSRGRRFLDKFKWRSATPSPAPSPAPPPASPGVKRRNSATGQPIETSVSQSLRVSASRPHSSYSEASTLQAHGSSSRELTARSNVPVGAIVPSGDHGSPSSSDVQGSHVSVPISAPIIRVSSSQSEPIASENLASSLICSPTSTLQPQAPVVTDVQAAVPTKTMSTPSPDVIESSPHSSMVWDKILEIVKNKISDYNLPLASLEDFTIQSQSQSAEDNIRAVVKALDTLQEDDKKKRWKYTWRGKEIIIVERLENIRKNMDQYLNIVGTAIQSSPQGALVWAGIRTIMQVSM